MLLLTLGIHGPAEIPKSTFAFWRQNHLSHPIYLSILRRAQQRLDIQPVSRPNILALDMALMTTAESSASSESRTSSPEHSPEMAPSASTSATSPLSLSAPLTTSQDEHERETDSRRSTPARLSPQDLTRSRPPTRGGCWYVAARSFTRDASSTHSHSHTLLLLGRVVSDERYVTILCTHEYVLISSADVQKCDEERVEENSCRTCKRLGIKCLGWGTRRPDWMRVSTHSRTHILHLISI